MQVAINAIRVLIFASSLVCLTTDADVLSILGTLYDGLNNGINTNVFIYFIFNDTISVLICGYYTVTIEKKWNTAPTKADYTICCIEIILWTIYAILRFVNNNFGPMVLAYSIMIIIFYSIYAILLYQWANKISLSGGSLPSLGQNAMNNPGMRNHAFRNNPTNPVVEMNSPVTGTNSPYNTANNSYSPTNNPYNNPTNIPYNRTNNLYNPTNNPYNPTNNTYNVTNNPYNPAVGIVNNAGAERNNAGAERNNNAGAERNNNAGAERNNNAGAERFNPGSEYSYNLNK